MRGIVIDMDEAKLQTVAQVKVFLEETHDIALKVPKAEQYGFIERVLKRFGYGALPDFHADNGSEYINYKVARLLEKLRIEFTKSRPRHSNDNALVEAKNGALFVNI